MEIGPRPVTSAGGLPCSRQRGLTPRHASKGSTIDAASPVEPGPDGSGPTESGPTESVSGADGSGSDARADAVAGFVLGVQSVPDGLANGLLAGVNPVAGLYAYMTGTIAGGLTSSTPVMAVQGTGAMAIIVADVGLGRYEDPERALVTLTVLTGLVMLGAGLLRLGPMLRFVSRSVLVGFIAAVGVNIVLGQLDTFTGYEASGGNRITQTLDLLLNVFQVDPASVVVGGVTIVTIVVLQRTSLGALGLVVAVVVGSVLAGVLPDGLDPVVLVGDVAAVPQSLPLPLLPDLAAVPALLLPAMSLAMIGLVQGAGVTAAYPPRDGRQPDVSRDFSAQGIANVVAGLLRGVPVGASMSATSLAAQAGAVTRRSMVVAGAVMAAVVLLAAGLVELVAMPSLAALLIVIGLGTVRPTELASVARTGTVQAVVVSVTFGLTILIPLQFAVVAGVALSTVLYVVRQSHRVEMRRLVLEDDHQVRETRPPTLLGPGDVVILQPYGSLFFASTPVLEEQLPRVEDAADGALVVLRLRGVGEVGATLVDALEDYGRRLRRAGARLVVVTDSDRVERQLTTGDVDGWSPVEVRRGTRFQLATVRAVVAEAAAADDGRM